MKCVPNLKQSNFASMEGYIYFQWTVQLMEHKLPAAPQTPHERSVVHPTAGCEGYAEGRALRWPCWGPGAEQQQAAVLTVSGFEGHLFHLGSLWETQMKLITQRHMTLWILPTVAKSLIEEVKYVNHIWKVCKYTWVYRMLKTLLEKSKQEGITREDWFLYNQCLK